MDPLTELLAQLRNSKDENGSRYAVKRLAEMLKEDEGTAVQLMRASANLEEVFSLWDGGVSKTASPAYVEHLCWIFESVIERCDDSKMDCVCMHMMAKRRIKYIHSLLSSGNRTKVSCGLHLLTAIAKRGSSHVSGILEHVDFSLGAIKVIGVPPKISGGRVMNAAESNADGEYAVNLWNSNELSKKPTRVAFVNFFMAMIEHCDLLDLPLVLHLKHFVSNALKYCSKDPYPVQKAMLEMIDRRVLRQPNVVLTPPTIATVLPDNFLSQLAQIVQQSWIRVSDEDGLCEQVMEIASGMLTNLLSEPRYGIIPMDSVPWDVFFNGKIDQSGRHRAVKFLMSLKPAHSRAHLMIFRNVFARDPIVAALYLQRMTFELDPKKLSLFVVNISLLVMCHAPLVADLERRPVNTSHCWDSILYNWESISSPKGVTKSGLSKLLQHPTPFVAHASVVYLIFALKTLSVVLDGIGEALDKKRAALQCTKRVLPDFQLVIAYHTKVLTALEEKDPSHRSQQLSSALELVGMWVRLFPESLVEANFHVEKLVPPNIEQFNITNQSEYLEILCEAEHDCRLMQLSPAFDLVLKMALHNKSDGSMRNLCFRWLLDQLNASKIFYDSNASCYSWLSNALRYSDFVSDFFSDTLKTVMKRLPLYINLVIEACESFESSGKIPPVTPIYSCALQKMCRILKSKRAREDKLDIVRFLVGISIECISQSCQPAQYLSVFRHIMMTEFLPENPGDAKRKRGEAILGSSMVSLCPEMAAEDFVDILAIARIHDLNDTQKETNGSSSKRESKKRRKSDGSKQSSALKEMNNEEKLGYFGENLLSCWGSGSLTTCGKLVHFWIAGKDPDDGFVELLSADISSSIAVLQHMIIYGRNGPSESASVNAMKTLSGMLSKTKSQSESILDAFFGPKSDGFWICLSERLQNDLELCFHLLAFVQSFQRLDSSLKEKLYQRILQMLWANKWQSCLVDMLEHNIGMILTEMIVQCPSLASAIEVDSILSLVDKSFSVLATGTSGNNELHPADSANKIVSHFIDRSKKSDLQSVLNALEASLSGQLCVAALHKITLYAKLRTRLHVGTIKDSRIATQISQLVLNCLPDERSSYCFQQFVQILEPENGTNMLLAALEKAKSEDSKYNRRLMLAAIAPALDSYLMRYNSFEVVDPLRKAFVKPIMQFYTSKSLQQDVLPKHEFLFNDLSKHFVRVLVHLVSKDPERFIWDELEPLIASKPRIGLKADGPICNPKFSDKMFMLTALLKEFSQISRDFKSREASYICRMTLFLMKTFVHQSKQGINGVKVMIKTMDVLGDLLVRFDQESRQSKEFIDLMDYWSTLLVKSVFFAKGNQYNINVVRCLRRFTASLLPEEEEDPMFASTKSTDTMYNRVSNLFLDIVGHDYTLEILRDSASSPMAVPQEYLSNVMPLESVVSCLREKTLASNSFDDVTENRKMTSLLKKEVCELLESILDLASLLERSVSSETAEDFRDSYEKAENALLSYLLASYGGSLSVVDMSTWSLIQNLNKRMYLRSQHGSPSVSDGEISIAALLDGPIALKCFSWGPSVLSNKKLLLEDRINPLRCAMTVLGFPEWRHLVENDRLPDSALPEETSPEYFMTYERSGYDPAFFLPMILVHLRSKTLSMGSLMKSMSLSVILRSLGSADDFLRATSYECLGIIDANTPQHFEEENSKSVERVRILVDWLRNSVTHPFQRLKSVHAVFAAELAAVLSNPASEFYPFLTRYLVKEAIVDHDCIPLSKKLLSTPTWILKQWMQKLLICGMRHGDDVRLYTKPHIFELSMARASSHHAKDNRLAVILIHQAAHVPKAARIMSESCGILGWLASKIVSDLEAYGGSDKENQSITLLIDTWRVVSSWKGILQRGSEKDRVNAIRDMSLSRARLNLLMDDTKHSPFAYSKLQIPV